ncbi:Superoxide-generating NADPH oxidase heavy chain subunit C [Triticum urartu]|uniref:ferric-chelate reductase (NADH) n=1 Tax=Triticum urartu TaxID=4572 RepID=M7ZQD1_TRIUA|nr:Superoxide-generating NADPH oxidase heavy chain subunit C [Triticum urartu]
MTQEREPLLKQNGGAGNAAAGAKGSPAVLPSLARSVLKFLMWAVFLTWAAGIFFYPTAPVQAAFRKWADITSTEGLITGLTGTVFLFFSGPILLIAALAYVYIFAFAGDHVQKKKLRSLSFRLWTFPVLVDGPLGVVSAVEFIGIVLFIVYIVFSMTYYVVDSVSFISKAHLPPTTRRGSVLLRLIDIPFEHATRYHVWLGHLTMALFTLHGLCYVISWSLLGRLIEELIQWKEVGIANLAGVISLAAGLLMWVTSLHPVRKRFFELFFYTHQLYVVFVVFLVLHVGDFVFSISAGAVFLFMLDRFLRFWQSRTKVDIVSAACRPCGTVELVFSKPPSLRYNALSFIFVQVRELSFLQWHPFSVSSSPMDGRYHMSILIKVLGTWTDTLKRIITDVQEQKTRSDSDSDQSQTGRITASIEGPYGHESPYHLMYENLILVAGGIGISPFLAILSDIIHRVEQGMPCAPKNVLVLWSVKKTSELSLLLAVDAQSISSSVSDKLHLDIQAFVTQESDPPLEDGIVGDDQKSPGIFVKNGTAMSGLVGTGDNFWAAMYFAASTLGSVLAFVLVQLYYVKRYNVTRKISQGAFLFYLGDEHPKSQQGPWCCERPEHYAPSNFLRDKQHQGDKRPTQLGRHRSILSPPSFNRIRGHLVGGPDVMKTKPTIEHAPDSESVSASEEKYCRNLVLERLKVNPLQSLNRQRKSEILNREGRALRQEGLRYPQGPHYHIELVQPSFEAIRNQPGGLPKAHEGVGEELDVHFDRRQKTAASSVQKDALIMKARPPTGWRFPCKVVFSRMWCRGSVATPPWLRPCPSLKGLPLTRQVVEHDFTISPINSSQL